MKLREGWLTALLPGVAEQVEGGQGMVGGGEVGGGPHQAPASLHPVQQLQHALDTPAQLLYLKYK